MPHRVGDETDDYCTHCHRLTNHTVAALVGDGIATTTCRTCGFQHPYRGGKVPARTAKPRASAFDQVLAGILATQPEQAAPLKRGSRTKKR
ncbi:MAG: hypothetical protein ACRD1C_11195 [Terriglobales bacterium]